MMVRHSFSLIVTSFALFAFVLVDIAAARGEGWWGPTSERVVTFWGLGMVVFFPLLITVLTIIQTKREKAKERRKADLTRLGGE